MAFAQSDNYWSWNFNTPSSLLSGAVVGGNAGPSSIYYNPALIDHGNVPALTVSANILSLQFLNVNNVAGNGIDANQFIFKVQPRFISYTLPVKNNRLGIEVAILSPISEEVRFSLQHDNQLDIIERTQGLETYTGFLEYSRSYDDTWVGGGASYQVSDNLFLGLSSFVSIKLLKYKYSQSTKAFQENDSVLVGNLYEPKYIAESSFEEKFKYWYLSFIFKVGAQYISDSKQVSVGINITLPDLPIYGEADIRKSVSRSNIYDNSSQSMVSNETTVQSIEDSKVRVKNPFSIAIGGQYKTEDKKNFILLTAEYFHRIKSYAVVQSTLPPPNWLPNYFENKLSGNDFMSYNFEANSVTNVAVGFKHQISSSLIFLGGFRTDFTISNTDNPRFVTEKFAVNRIHFNKYHLTGGVVLKIKKFGVIGGAQYTRGKTENMPEMINYTTPREYIPETDQSLEGYRQNNTVAILNELSLFFGLTVDFD